MQLLDVLSKLAQSYCIRRNVTSDGFTVDVIVCYNSVKCEEDVAVLLLLWIEMSYAYLWKRFPP